ncbi:hypothetical protein NBRC116188_22870 [Oceaniserpentilla sp. 4NH20-0058]|uniref:hypothetical protein n=1 Tax=Oceaniserpentilla sp. 4NH20-0058 TaxID=3127660 RepID=UPI0031080482
MKNTIIMWAMLVLLSFLTACGGSDSSSNNFTKSDPGTEEDTTDDDDSGDDGSGDDTPDELTEDEVAVALGVLVGTAFTQGTAETGLSDNESLSASGSTTITVDIVDPENGNAQFFGLREVSFVSTCVEQGLATIAPESIKASGSATVTYTDKGCGKEFGVTDTVAIFVEGEADTNDQATARTTITIQAAEIGAIQFVSATPSLIALSGYGTGDVPSLSTVAFQVLDRSGNPMPDRTVRFELDHLYGGASLSLEEAITSADGTVNVILNAGAAAGNVRVKALIDITNTAGTVLDTITTMSIPITMATSLGDQNSFSLSATPFNPSAWSVDGATVDLSVRVGDHNQNPVIDGTRVYFRASGGLITPSCETADGVCNVQWQSSNPRPVDGYLTIVGFTRGQSDFQDANSNGLFDLGEVFTTYGESYIDANGSGTFETAGDYQPNVDLDGDGAAEFGWNPDHYRVFVDSNGTPAEGGGDVNFLEEFIDSNNSGELDEAPSSLYQGVNCSDAAFAGGHCAEQIDLVGSVRIQMSQGNSAFIEGPFGWDSTLGRYDTDNVLTCVDGSFDAGGQDVAWRVADSSSRRNHLPSGSTIVLALDETKINSSSGTGDVGSIHPASTWPLRNGTANLTDEQVYDYLNSRGHLITANIIRADEIENTTGLGTVGISVTTVDSGTIIGGILDVDLIGYSPYLFKNSFSETSVNVRGGTETYTVKIKNRCNLGLPENATVQIRLTNGTLGTVTPSGGAGAVLSSDASSATVSVNDSSQTTIVDLTISPDGVQDVINGGLEINYFVPAGSDFTTYLLGNFTVTD